MQKNSAEIHMEKEDMHRVPIEYEVHAMKYLELTSALLSPR